MRAGRRDPFRRPTADPALLAPWLLELARTAPWLVRSYLPGSPIDARTRERVNLAVTEVNRCRYSAWVHGGWAAYLGADLDDPEASEDPEDAEGALLAHARACAEAGRPLDPGALHGVLPEDAVAALRATVARIELANLVGNTVDGLLARAAGRRPLDAGRAVGEAATVAAALPLALPMLATGAVLRLVHRLAPRPPALEVPADDDANLLVHVLSRTAPTYLANAGVRLVSLRFPVPVTVGIRAGRSSATVRIGRGRVAIENGIAADAVVVLEGDLEPILQLAAGSLARELRTLRLKLE